MKSHSIKTAQAVVHDWCSSNGIVLEPLSGADLVGRIAKVLAVDTAPISPSVGRDDRLRKLGCGGRNPALDKIVDEDRIGYAERYRRGEVV